MAEERVQRRLAAILAADVVGYSRLMEADEVGTRAGLRSINAELIEPRVAGGGGRIVKTTGDGLLVEFASAIDAVRNALAIQDAMRRRNADLPETDRIEFRVGINVGDVIIEGDDIHGDGVNVAARLEGLCEPGAVFVSRSVHDQVAGKIAASFDDLGERALRNISRAVRVFRVRPGPAAKMGGAEPKQAPASPDRPSIAVLPFANLGDDSAQDYLADGIRLAIQGALVHIPGLFLIAPPAVQHYRNREVAAVEVARELGVRYVLEGAAQRVAERIRITVQLTDAEAGRLVWAERYDRPHTDMLATQDEITAEIVNALGVQIVGGTHGRDSLKNLDALHAFYRGLNHFYARTRDSNAAAIREFEDVARLQPDSPIGPAYLCMSHWNDAFMGWSGSRNRSLMQAVEWAEKAVKFTQTNGLAHIVLACIHLLNRRHDEALATCHKAVELRPNCPMANASLANVLHHCGRSAEAVASIEEAIRILLVPPPWFLTVLADAYREIGDVDRSISTARTGIEKFPRNIEARLILCSDYETAGMDEPAKSVAREITELDPAFSISRYIEKQPYRHKDENFERRFVESLRRAGLPE